MEDHRKNLDLNEKETDPSINCPGNQSEDLLKKTIMIKMQRIFPFLRWFPMSSEILKADTIAGVTVALLLIPQSMAYAELAGLPVYYGLYAAFIPVILGALFGALPQLGAGPSAMTSILTASILVKYADPQQETLKYVQLAVLLALVVGLVRVALGLFRMAIIVNFLSLPVISGFTNAGAIIIGCSQLNKIFGISLKSTSGTFGLIKDLFSLFTRLPQTHPPTLCFGLGTMVAIYVIKKYWPRLPSMLLAVIVSIIVSAWIGFESLGGTVVATIPEGLPRIGLLEWSWNGAALTSRLHVAIRMLPDALMLSLIGFMEVVAVSRVISMQTKQPLNLNQELIGQGIAAIGAGLSQGYPTSASFSRSAINLMVGAKTGLCSIVTGLGVMVVLLGMTKYLYHLPKATLAAGVIIAIISLIDFSPIFRAWRASRQDGMAGIVTFIATLCFAPDIMRGVFLGASLSLGLYLYRTMKPQVSILGRAPDGTLQDVHEFCLDRSQYIAVLRFKGSLYFASVARFENSIITAVAEHPNARYVLVVAEGINRIDASGEWALRQVIEHLQENNLTLVFAALHQEPMEVLARTGLVQVIGEENFFTSADAAIADIYTRLEKQGKQPKYRLLKAAQNNNFSQSQK